ncbi:MAG: YdeI/OmpD-associated family protein [Ginsengibacter sp.]
MIFKIILIQKGMSNKKVDFYFEKPGKWQKEVTELRKIILSCGLNEELKWGVPCYLSDDRNIVLIHKFKEYCALLFFKGALLKDTNQILIQQSQNVQAARQVRFTSALEIVKLKSDLKAYIYEAIEVEKSGLKVPIKETSEYEVPEEFQEKLNADDDLKKAFQNLTPGRQRAYLLYFSAAKQSKTRKMRIEKYIPAIKKGKGLNN